MDKTSKTAQEFVATTAAVVDEQLTKSLTEALKKVFVTSDKNDTEEMKILIRRVPILCTNIEQMHKDIASIQGNLTWGVRIVLSAIILGVLALLFKG